VAYVCLSCCAAHSRKISPHASAPRGCAAALSKAASHSLWRDSFSLKCCAEGVSDIEKQRCSGGNIIFAADGIKQVHAQHNHGRGDIRLMAAGKSAWRASRHVATRATAIASAPRVAVAAGRALALACDNRIDAHHIGTHLSRIGTRDISAWHITSWSVGARVLMVTSDINKLSTRTRTSRHQRYVASLCCAAT